MTLLITVYTGHPRHTHLTPVRSSKPSMHIRAHIADVRQAAAERGRSRSHLEMYSRERPQVPAVMQSARGSSSVAAHCHKKKKARFRETTGDGAAGQEDTRGGEREVEVV